MDLTPEVVSGHTGKCRRRGVGHDGKKEENAIMSKISLLAEFWEFLKYRKKFWLVPIVLVLIVMGLAIVSMPAALTPFIYPF